MLDQTIIDRLRTKAMPAQLLFITGRDEPASDGRTLDVVSLIDGERIMTMADDGAADVEHAVTTTRTAFDKGTGSARASAERKKTLFALVGLIERDAGELAVLSVRDNGTEISKAYWAEPLSAAGAFRYYAGAIDKVYREIAPME